MRRKGEDRGRFRRYGVTGGNGGVRQEKTEHGIEQRLKKWGGSSLKAGKDK